MNGKCEAKTRRGGRCQRAACVNGRCHLHGGRSLRGSAHPGFKDGRWSKYLPDQLRARYEAGERDPNALSLRADLAATDSRIAELMGRLDTGESGRLWKALRASWTAVTRAYASRDA
jgi:hypothetical protein